jgi:hypothetical protein
LRLAVRPLFFGAYAARSATAAATGGIAYLSNYTAGDGTTDDTAGINAALSSGASLVIGEPGATYLISRSGTKRIGAVTQAWCIAVPSGVTFDGNGATLLLANGANACMIVLGSDDSSAPAVRSAIRNWIINGNMAGQTPGFAPCLHLANANLLSVENISVFNASDTAGRFCNCRGSRFIDLYCSASSGAGFVFGAADSGQLLSLCKIDGIYAELCAGLQSNIAGNPTTFVISACSVGKIFGRNCQAGHKIQNTSSFSAVEAAIFDGSAAPGEPALASANSGTKIQGTASAGLIPAGIRIGAVVSTNCTAGQGLYIEAANDCTVESYHGSSNLRDIWLNGTRNRIENVMSVNCGTQGVVYARPTQVKCSVGTIRAENPAGRIVIDDSGKLDVWKIY